MDSVTQFALGAAIGELTMGRKIGNRAMLVGGLVATLPDLDILIPYGGPVENFTYHRSATHSLFILTAITPLVVWLVMKFNPDTRKYIKHWYLLVFLALFTHPILDCFTVYGTQIFWPFSEEPVAWSSMFIIDPAYTLPLLFGLASAASLSRSNLKGHNTNTIALVYSVIYLGWSLIAQNVVTNVAQKSLEQDGIKYSHLLINPAPLNTLLWRVLVMTDDGYHEGFYSLLDSDPRVKLTRYPNNHALLEPINDHWPVQRLKWFSRGFFSASRWKEEILMTDLRMGMEPYYIFRFKVGEWNGHGPEPVTNERRRQPRPLSMIPVVFKRIWDEGVTFVQAKN